MINEIKTIVKNYIHSAMLCDFITGTVETSGVRISDRTVIPNSIITGNLMNTMTDGDTVHMLRKQGGELYYILEIVPKQ